ncbi:MAG: hypothetical protein ACXU8Q_11085 [Caulobacteraceae bacterium]
MSMRPCARSLLAGLVMMAAAIADPASARTILFVGNSFTFGELSAAKRYQTSTVTDLNGPDSTGRTLGGMPAIFKEFTVEAGLDYQVSLETAPGMGLDYHYAQKLPLLDKAWDDVVLQSFSTLDAAHPGEPSLLIQFAGRFTDTLTARNPQVRIWLDATWSRADLTYPPDKPWSGKPIQKMAEDVEAGYEAALKATPKAAGLVQTGLAFNRAIAVGLADPDPYDGIGPSQIDIWAVDGYHASTYGYYLEALMVFGRVTGRDPLSLGDREHVAGDFGFSAAQTRQLQQIAHDQLAEAQNALK